MLRFTLYAFHEFLNLFEDASRRESWEDFPLKFRLHAIDAIQFLEVVVLRIPFNFTHPSRVWVGDSGPTSLPYSFDFPGQLKNWLCVQRVSSKL